jgi:hypothetical protein
MGLPLWDALPKKGQEGLRWKRIGRISKTYKYMVSFNLTMSRI